MRYLLPELLRAVQFGMGASGGRVEESARVGFLAFFLGFAYEIVFVRGKEKEGEKSLDNRVQDTGFHCRARGSYSLPLRYSFRCSMPW